MTSDKKVQGQVWSSLKPLITLKFLLQVFQLKAKYSRKIFIVRNEMNIEG